MRIEKLVINHYHIEEDTSGSLDNFREKLSEDFPGQKRKIKNTSDKVIQLYKELQDLSEDKKSEFIDLLMDCY